MKLYVVYLWEPYEVPIGHKYFLDVNKARAYYEEMYKDDHFWEIEDIETED